MKIIFKIYLPLIIILIAGLHSCKIGQKYSRPELNLPEKITEQQSDTTTLADLDWKTVYTDTLLQSLIQKALDNNKDMLIAASRIKELAYRKRISAGELFPRIDAAIHPEREYTNDGGNNSVKDDSFEGKLTLSWEIDLWGNLRWARAESIAEYLASIEAKRALQMSMIAQVAQYYYELVALDNELNIVRQTLDTWEKGLELARIRFEGGLTSETSFRQAQVELARTATLVPELENKISQKENDLSLLIGEYKAVIVRAKMNPDIFLPEYLPVGLPSTLLERRPDLRQAEQELKAAHAQVGVAFTNMFPKLTLTARYGIESSSLNDFLRSPDGFIGGTLLSPIFGAGKNIAKHKAQKEVFKQTCYSYEKSVLTAFQETRDAIVNFNKVKEARVLKKNLYEASKGYIELARLQYINGVINYLDVLDAQRGFFDAQIGLSNAIRNEQIAVVYLYKALGGGWDNLSPFNKEEPKKPE